MSEAIKCPACGKIKKPESVPEYDCEYCGFQNAFVDFFTDERSYDRWRETVQTAVKKLMDQRRSTLSKNYCLKTGSRMISFFDPDMNQIYIAQGNGKVHTEQDSIGFDSNERNYAIVFRNGTVKVYGNDNEFGQKDTGDWRDICQVLLTPYCTYGVTKKGTVLYAGSPANTQISQWKNIRTLKACEDFLVGIQKDGTLVFSENIPADSEWRKAQKWSSIQDLALFREGIVGLAKAGTVVFAGKEEDLRGECHSWQDLIAIDADNAYIYGLSKNGEVRMAGQCKRFLDRGRSKASEWKNVLVISCNQAGIGALDEQGNFHFAGTLAGDEEKITSACKRFMTETV